VRNKAGKKHKLWIFFLAYVTIVHH